MDEPEPAVALGKGWRWLPCRPGTDHRLAAVAASLVTQARLPADLTGPLTRYLEWFSQLAQVNEWEHAQVRVAGSADEVVIAFFVQRRATVAGLRLDAPVGDLVAVALADNHDHVVDPVAGACVIDGVPAARSQTFVRMGDEPGAAVWEVVTYVVPGPDEGEATILHGLSPCLVHGAELGADYDAIAGTLRRRRRR